MTIPWFTPAELPLPRRGRYKTTHRMEVAWVPSQSLGCRTCGQRFDFDTADGVLYEYCPCNGWKAIKLLRKPEPEIETNGRIQPE